MRTSRTFAKLCFMQVELIKAHNHSPHSHRISSNIYRNHIVNSDNTLLMKRLFLWRDQREPLSLRRSYFKIPPSCYLLYWTPRFTITYEPTCSLVTNTVSVLTAQVKSPLPLHRRSLVVIIPVPQKISVISFLSLRIDTFFQVTARIIREFETKKKKRTIRRRERDAHSLRCAVDNNHLSLRRMIPEVWGSRNSKEPSICCQRGETEFSKFYCFRRLNSS